MHIPTSFLLLSAFLLPALTAPLPQEGNNQIEEFNVSPTPKIPASTAAAIPSATDAPFDPLQQPKKPKIEAQDGMKAGMGAAMAGVGQAAQALSALPVVGSLAGSAGGLGARDVPVKHEKRLLEAITSLLGGLGGLGGGKVKRGTVDSALYPKLQDLPDMGSAGLVNLGSNNKRDAEPQLDVLKSLPGISSLFGKVKRQLGALNSLPILGSVLGGGNNKREAEPQLDVLKSLPGVSSLLGKTKRQISSLGSLPLVGSLLGGKNKRDASPEPPLDVLKGLPSLPIVGGIVGGDKPPKVKRAELGLDGIKKVAAIVADIRGVTSKREAAPAPEEGDFRQELRKANKAKVDGELSDAADKAERKVKIKNTKFPPNGGKVKSPHEALDKREESVVEKRQGLSTLPLKDIADSMTGLKSAVDLLESANAAFQNANGK